MGKVQWPMHQYTPDGGGDFSRKFEDGARDHTNVKGVPFMPAKGLYYPGADEPQTGGFYYAQKLISIPNPPEFTDYLIKDIKRIPETFVLDPNSRPLEVATTEVNLPELTNLLQNEYKLEFSVLKPKKSFITNLRILASSLKEK